LYAPTASNLLAYTQCEIEALLNATPNCDCQLTTNKQNTNTANLPHKHKDGKEQSDVKYLTQKGTSFCYNHSNASTKYFTYNQLLLPSPFAGAVFHPPAC
jgi:hypothetical protein